MNVRTAVELCRIDLLRLIEAGDFRKMVAAEGVIDAQLATLPNERDQSILLYRLQDELTLVDVSDRPEADACLRALRAFVRRRIQERFARGPYQPYRRLPYGRSLLKSSKIKKVIA